MTYEEYHIQMDSLINDINKAKAATALACLLLQKQQLIRAFPEFSEIYNGSLAEQSFTA